MLSEKSPFHQFVDMHPEMKAEDAYRVFKVYNFSLTEAESREKFRREIEEYEGSEESRAVLAEALTLLGE